MKVGSLFTGAGGFDAALERCGMKVVWQAEIDRQCRSVTARHWPDVVMYDDVRKVRAYLEPKNARRTAVRPERCDLLCGGFPCQDISVAGRRAGLAGSRSGLWFTFRRIAALIRPRWLLIENVDGLRSSNGGRDLGAILKALGDMGYGWAYRVFDSQWFGLAQRRERVFIVGCLGDWRCAGEVLFERNSLPWDSPPSRTQGTRVAASLTRGADSGGRGGYAGRRREDDVNLALCLNAKGGCGRIDGESETFIPTVASPITAGYHKGPGVNDGKKGSPHNLIVGTLSSHSAEHGHAMATQQAAEAGQLVAFYSNESHSSGNNDNICPTLKVGTELDVPTAPAVAYAIQERAGAVSDTAGPGGKGWQEDIGYTLESRHTPQTIYFAQNQRDEVRDLNNLAGAVAAEPGMKQQTFVAAFQTRIARNGRGQPKEITDALTSCEGGTHADSKPHVSTGYGVRRLTPRECERLQGFPDDWTRWDSDGNELPDSPRYRMMGNAVSLPPVEWIGRRIMEEAA